MGSRSSHAKVYDIQRKYVSNNRNVLFNSTEDFETRCQDDKSKVMSQITQIFANQQQFLSSHRGVETWTERDVDQLTSMKDRCLVFMDDVKKAFQIDLLVIFTAKTLKKKISLEPSHHCQTWSQSSDESAQEILESDPRVSHVLMVMITTISTDNHSFSRKHRMNILFNVLVCFVCIFKSTNRKLDPIESYRIPDDEVTLDFVSQMSNVTNLRALNR